MAQSHSLAFMPGMELLQEPRLNKSTAFAQAEREAPGLTGLLPDVVEREDIQLKRVLQQLEHKTSDLERYIYLRDAALKLGYLTAEQFDQWVRPADMTHPL